MNAFYPDREFGAFLFDMDGTILTSIAAAERVWSKWATGHGIDLAQFLPTLHGMRAVETISRLGLPGIDIAAEAEKLTQAEIDDVDGIESIAGAPAFLASLPADRWALVTSAPRRLAERRLSAAGLPMPPLIVAGDDVTRGKPAPDCFLLAAERLGRDPSECLVFEDAPAGIQAAEAAGMSVMVITAMHAHAQGTHHPTLSHYDEISLLAGNAGRFRLARVERARSAIGA